MRSSAPLLQGLAVLGLAVAPAAQASGPQEIWLPMCHGGTRSAPVPVDRGRHPEQCPGACHALCCRTRPDADDGDGDLTS